MQDQDPLDLYKKTIGKQIQIHLFDKTTYTGELVGFDIYVNTVLKNAILNDSKEQIKECIINGQNITFIEIC